MAAFSLAGDRRAFLSETPETQMNADELEINADNSHEFFVSICVHPYK
jgi:hypothetical protein